LAQDPPAAAAARGAKRTAVDLEALLATVASFVKAHPGPRIEQINMEIGTTTRRTRRCRNPRRRGTLGCRAERLSTAGIQTF
jgi:hypothetical protein